MKVVKFRAKQKHTGQWVYGDYVQRRHSDMQFIEFIQDGKHHLAVVDEKTVGQFTTFYINETQEVYAGDILKVFCKNQQDFILYEVVFNEKRGAWWSKCISLHLKEDNYKTVPPDDYYDEYLVDTLPDAEKVGIIHEELDMAIVIN